jgi:energy-coupling factor transport system permease protein
MYIEKLRIVKTNPISALYPFSKLWIALFYAIGAMVLSGIRVDGYPVYMMISFLIVPLLALLSGTFKKITKVLKAMFFLVTFIVILQTLLVKTDNVLTTINVFNLFDLRLYKDSLQYALTLSFSILCMGGILAWFFSTTENKELICACEKAGMGPKVAFVFLSTLQMIDVMQKNSKTIMSAQQARGVETEGNVFVRAKAFVPSMIPLILAAVTNTEERVLTLESKGFSVKGERSRLFDVERNGKETFAVTLAIIFAALAIVWRIIEWVM